MNIFRPIAGQSYHSFVRSSSQTFASLMRVAAFPLFVATARSAELHSALGIFFWSSPPSIALHRNNRHIPLIRCEPSGKFFEGLSVLANRHLSIVQLLSAFQGATSESRNVPVILASHTALQPCKGGFRRPFGHTLARPRSARQTGYDGYVTRMLNGTLKTLYASRSSTGKTCAGWTARP